MYVISKFVWILAQPSSLLLIAFAFGLWQLKRGSLDRAVRWIGSSLAVALVAGFTNLSGVLIAPLESRFARPDLGQRPVNGIIMLGGAQDSTGDGVRELMALNEAGERVVETLALARRFPAARVIVSGASGAILAQRPAEADLVGRFLIEMGIAKERLVLEAQSRTTFENARFTQALGVIKPGEHWLLVTSAWHMPRAIGTFRQVGLDVAAWPVDYRTHGPGQHTIIFPSFVDGLRRVDMVSREYMGLLVYRLTGRSSTLLPR